MASVKKILHENHEIEETVRTYSDMLFRLCYTMLSNRTDAEDAVSETFIRYMTNSNDFSDLEYKKAWLIRVASNICNDMFRFKKRNSCVCIEELENIGFSKKEYGLLDEVLRLDKKYKSVVHLFYIEGYKTDEIAKILSISPSAVRKRLQYAREKLKMEYER